MLLRIFLEEVYHLVLGFLRLDMLVMKEHVIGMIVLGLTHILRKVFWGVFFPLRVPQRYIVVSLV